MKPWLLSFYEPVNDWFDFYLVTSHDFECKDEIDEVIKNIIEEFESSGKSWTASDIAFELDVLGFENEYINSHVVNI